ncbi:hypothetical protein DL240_06220 [Lujinxingia litoralis]|uniref:DUF4350 domain-containing protein n=2 Tax=Lujinxingia litoralis TaxID=2211119 RepID=A0A328C9Y8_9DELT|nr:hypothetical protein DL240_06220 [Lujinxingia litoralis]
MMVAWSLVAHPARAGEYDPDSTDWQGMARFAELVRRQSGELHVVDELDWSRVHPEDVLVVVYPTRALDSENFAAFLVDGGRLLLADDFGGGAGLMERLSLQRLEPLPEALPHHNFVGGEPEWPRHVTRGRHPLLVEVEEVISNVPALLLNQGGPVVAFDEGAGLVYDMTLGEGRAVVVSDPSLWINAMLPVADNERLAVNSVDYLCEPVGEGCRVWLVHGDFDTRHGYRRRGSGDGAEGAVVARIERINERVRHIFKELAQTELLYFLGLLLSLGSVSYLATVLPWRRSRRLSEFVQRERHELAPPQTEFDWNVARFSRLDRSINQALPMAILKEVFEEIFLDALGLWPSTSKTRPPIDVVAREFDARYSGRFPDAERGRRRKRVQDFLSLLAGVPTRHRVFLESDIHYSAGDLARFYQQAHEILGWMGKEADYERRTRQHHKPQLAARRGG